MLFAVSSTHNQKLTLKQPYFSTVPFTPFLTIIPPLKVWGRHLYTQNLKKRRFIAEQTSHLFHFVSVQPFIHRFASFLGIKKAQSLSCLIEFVP